MADLRLQYDEVVVGANHPTKDDTANRLALVELDIDGKGKARYLKEQTADPATAAGEVALYSKRVSANLEAFLRGESNATPLQVTNGGVANLLAGMRITAIQSGLSTGAMAAQYRQLWNIALSPAVDLSKSFAVISGIRVDSGRPGFKFKLSAANNLEVYIINNNPSTSNWAFNWAVYTCENISVQRGEVAQAFGGAGAAGPGTVTISSAPVANSFLIYGGVDQSINSTVNPSGTIGHTGDTSLTWYLSATAASTVYLPWQLVTVEH